MAAVLADLRNPSRLIEDKDTLADRLASDWQYQFSSYFFHRFIY
jgi:hypothetical protein